MRKWIWAALLTVPLAAAGGFGLVYANSHKDNSGGYVCPITGEELPCPNCCPLNQGK
jgi:hypothetical protein